MGVTVSTEAVEAFALAAGQVDEELLLRNEYLAAEIEILLSKLNDRPQLTDSERIRLAKLGKRLGLKALKTVVASSAGCLELPFQRVPSRAWVPSPFGAWNPS